MNVDAERVVLAVQGACQEIAVTVREIIEELPEQPTLRDRFAMEAMNGMISFDANVTQGDDDPENVSRMAYKYADAMLAARRR